MKNLTYNDAGVSLDKAEKALKGLGEAVKSTHNDNVLHRSNSFGGMFSLSGIQSYKDPVLVASTDGVGTKSVLAGILGKYDTLGHDIVNHCINDVLTSGANPLFFLDYFATSKLEPSISTSIVRGCAEACREAGCVILGGEIAEMPGVYRDGQLDLVGTLVGVVERDEIIDGSLIKDGDHIVGLASSGPHTNGYSLIRSIFSERDFLRIFKTSSEKSLVERLLIPHRSYLPCINRIRSSGISIKGIAHITGGGIWENSIRVLPKGLAIELFKNSWPIPDIFNRIQEAGNIDTYEMYRVFNMGIGMMLTVPSSDSPSVLSLLGDQARLIGRVIKQSTVDQIVMVSV